MKHLRLFVAVSLASCAATSVSLNRESAIASAQANARVGDIGTKAIAKLQRAGFQCRRLQPHEYGSSFPEPIEVFNCYTSADRTIDGYTLVYATMTINRAGRLVQMHVDSYPVLFRNLRKDVQGRTIVVQEVRPVVATDNLHGRWTITEVNGKQVSGLWIELGGEGLATITERGNGIFVAPPQPQTRAHLGCNDWHPSGWTRNGDKLTLGTEMSRRTERGCDEATMALEEEAYVILHQTMTMEYTPPTHLRLINEKGTLELVRSEG